MLKKPSGSRSKTIYSTAFLDDNSYIHVVFGVVRKEGTLSVTGVPTLFEVLMWLHFLSIVRTEVHEKRLLDRKNYQTGNITGIVDKSLVMT